MVVPVKLYLGLLVVTSLLTGFSHVHGIFRKQPSLTLQTWEAPPSVFANTSLVTSNDISSGYQLQVSPAETYLATALLPLISQVFWTAEASTNLTLLAAQWGIPAQILKDLNPQINSQDSLPKGTQVRVYQQDPTQQSRSLGAPNRGRLEHGVPLPEQDAWRTKDNRRRVYGTPITITSLVQAFSAFSQRFPQSPPIRVGDISYRRGGRIFPHQSHQSGRDVDIGYFHNHAEPSAQKWVPTTVINFDKEKTWALIHELIKTGNVQTIYMHRRLQVLTYNTARAYVPEATLRSWFQYPLHPDSSKAIIQHWPGHQHHMHVRFRCMPNNPACRARSRP